MQIGVGIYLKAPLLHIMLYQVVSRTCSRSVSSLNVRITHISWLIAHVAHDTNEVTDWKWQEQYRSALALFYCIYITVFVFVFYE
jgi:hypothetical protein